MKNLVFILAIFCAGTANARIGGMLLINQDNTEAKLVFNETTENGELSKLFEEMKVEATGTETKKTKSFQMSNGRFSYICNKGLFINTPPSTSCTFVIKGGANTDDISTFISKTDGRKIATIGMSPAFSHELDGIFPTNPRGLISYILKVGNGVSLDAQGANSGNLMIEFSGQ